MVGFIITLILRQRQGNQGIAQDLMLYVVVIFTL